MAEAYIQGVNRQGGQLYEPLYAQNNASYGAAQVRNIYFGTADMVPGQTNLENGVIYLQYE